MTFAVEYFEFARADLYEIWSCYGDRPSGLRDRFASAVDVILDRLAEWPNSGAQVHRAEADVNEQIVGVADFPHAVRHRVAGDTVVAIANFHEQRRPGFGSERST